MEEKDLRITYGMVFKLASQIALEDFKSKDLEDRNADDYLHDVEYMAGKLFELAITGQEAVVSDYAHLITEKPKKRSGGGYSGSASRKGSGGGSYTKGAMTGPATDKQIALATRLLDEKEHSLLIDPDELPAMGKAEVSKIIDQLINA